MNIWLYRRSCAISVIVVAILSCSALAENAAEPWKNVARKDSYWIGYALGMASATSARCERYVMLGGDIGETLDLFAEFGVESTYLDGFNRGVEVIDKETFERACDRDSILRMVSGMYDFHPKFKEFVLYRKGNGTEYGICPAWGPLGSRRK